ncbi:MAG: LysE family translocator [Caulobacterales bacterium]
MTYELFIAFTVFAFVSCVTPGPNNLMLMASGTNFGFARTVPHAMGVNFGFVFMVLLVGLGLAQLFERFPAAQHTLRIASAIYLVYLAWKIANAAPPQAGVSANAKPMTFLQAALFQWVNPKAWTMALTAVTAYAPAENPMLGLAIIVAVFAIVDIPAVSAWMMIGVQARRFLDQPRALRTFNIIAALLLLASLYPLFIPSH